MKLIDLPLFSRVKRAKHASDKNFSKNFSYFSLIIGKMNEVLISTEKIISLNGKIFRAAVVIRRFCCYNSIIIIYMRISRKKGAVL